MSEVTKDAMCDICCRPKSRHIGRDLQCPETVYFRAMPDATAQAEAAALKAENEALRAQVEADRNTFRDLDIIDDPIGAAAQCEAAYRNCCAALQEPDA